MKPSDFVQNFCDEDFPRQLSKPISIDAHHPPFKKSELRKLAAHRYIVLDESTWTYQLTQKATFIKDKQQEGDK